MTAQASREELEIIFFLLLFDLSVRAASDLISFTPGVSLFPVLPHSRVRRTPQTGKGSRDKTPADLEIYYIRRIRLILSDRMMRAKPKHLTAACCCGPAE